MQLIKFGCPSCLQHIKARREILGEVISCPTCSTDFRWLDRIDLELPVTQGTGSRLIPGRVALVVIFALVGVVFALAWPFGFAVFTAIQSLRLIGRLEAERNVHELAFYTIGPPTVRARELLGFWGRCEAAGRSILLGMLTYFLFGGDAINRRLSMLALFALLLVPAVVVLRVIEQKVRVDVVRMGFLRLGVVFGVAFSFLANIFNTFEPKEALKAGWNSVTGNVSFGTAIDLTHQAANLLNWAIEEAFSKVVGGFFATFITAALNTDLFYGLILFVYAADILRFIAPVKRDDQRN